MFAICAVIAGADNWEDVEEFGKARLEWFRTFLELPDGKVLRRSHDKGIGSGHRHGQRLGQRWVGEEKNSEDRYHIASITGAKRILEAVHSHWGIENELHWNPDIAFDDDHCRVRKDHGPENLVMLRHIVLNLLKQEKTCKRGIKGKRLLAGWKQDYLLKILAGLAQMQI